MVVGVVGGELPQERGALVGVAGIVGVQVGLGEGLDSGEQAAADHPLVIPRDEPVLLRVIGRLPSPTVVRVVAGEKGSVFEV